MSNESLVLYGIGGLGADQRVFQYLSLSVKLIPVRWITPKSEECIEDYAVRLSEQIDKSKRFGLLGVSFGGLIALELSKVVEPELIILISSVTRSSDLPSIRNVARKVSLLSLIPNYLLKPPFVVMRYFFGAKNGPLLKEIIRDTDPTFLRWALHAIIEWNFDLHVDNLYLIHGSSDRLIPLKNKKAIEINEGGHFMIVDRAAEISKQSNILISRYA